MRIFVITDCHANLPALEAALAFIQQQGYDAIFHTGDAIGIGPFPLECVDLLLATPRLFCTKGNHDAWFADGLPSPQPGWMTDGEVEHQRWTHAQLTADHRRAISRWPYMVRETYHNVAVAYTHYAMTTVESSFVPIERNADRAALDWLFGSYKSDIIFYGHHHPPSDVSGMARYVNPGSLGCYEKPMARLVEMNIHEDGQFTLAHHALLYNDIRLLDAFEDRRVPERDFLYQAFFGGRFNS